MSASLRLRPEFFRRECTQFWATTYTFEPVVLEDLLLPYLAPSARATVLADAEHLAATWDGLIAEPERLRRANRRYLVRGVDAPGHAFHPKSFYFGREETSSLLIGSGNLSFGGVLSGRETFAAYDSTDPEGALAIAAWRDWMTRIVSALDDDAVSERWGVIADSIPDHDGDSGSSRFVHNLDAPLLSQLSSRLSGEADRLLVMAPFHDRDLSAISDLQNVANPKSIDLYLCEGAKIDGALLAAKVRSSTVPVRLLRPAPGEFVHAKLFGVVSGERGWLLSGSANCSDVALRLSGARANVECGSLLELPATAVIAAFNGPFETIELSVEDVVELQWEDDSDAEIQVPFALSLKSAVHLPDGRMEARFTGDLPGPIWMMSSDGALTGPLNLYSTESSVHVGLSEAVPAEQAIAIALADALGSRLSSWVPVDWPIALEGRDAEGTRTPDGLAEEDFATGYGQALAWLDEGMNYDVLLGSAGGGPPLALPPIAPGGGDGLPSQHQGDLVLPWRARYLERLRGLTGVPSLDDAIRELESFRDRLPGFPHEPQLHVVPSEDDEQFPETGATEDGDGGHPPVAEPPTTAGRRRFANALERRCWAAGNPRLYEEDTANAIRYVARLLSLLDGINGDPSRAVWVTETQMVRLVGRLLKSLIGQPGAPGLITVLKDADRQGVVAGLGTESTVRFGALVLWCIQPGVDGWKNRRFEWKASIGLGIEVGCLSGDEETADRLLAAATLMDDDHWPQEAKAVSGISVAVRRHEKMVRLELSLPDADRLFTDPAVPRLLAAWTNYAGVIGEPGTPDIQLAVAADDRGRVSIQQGELFAKRDGRILGGGVATPVTQSMLADLVSNDRTLGELLAIDGRDAESA